MAVTHLGNQVTLTELILHMPNFGILLFDFLNGICFLESFVADGVLKSVVKSLLEACQSGTFQQILAILIMDFQIILAISDQRLRVLLPIRKVDFDVDGRAVPTVLSGF